MSFQLNPHFIRPEYERACFAHYPGWIESLLTGQGLSALPDALFGNFKQQYETVIFFFVDGFGWRFFQDYTTRHPDRFPALQRFLKDGHAARLTSQFPSTTAAHVTTIHTGHPVGQSGVYEWQYYEPTLDAMIAPLLFSFAGDSERETLKKANVDPASLCPPPPTFYQQLKTAGVTPYVFQNRAYTPSPYSDVVFEGAEVVGYYTLPQALTGLKRGLAQAPRPAYFFLYFEKIDSIGHEHGPDSAYFEAEAEAFWLTVEQLFLKPLTGELKNTLLMVSADHGQTHIDPKTTVYLNQDPAFAGCERFFKRNQAGKLLAPAGSARDMFLYIKEGLVAEAQAFFAERLAGKAEVYQTATLLKEGFFGPNPSEALLARLAELVILPFPGQSVWWYEKDRFEQKFYGHHGGLTPAEMEIPLLLYSF